LFIAGFNEAGDGEREAAPANNTMHDLPDKTALSQLVDTNGRIRQM